MRGTAASAFPDLARRPAVAGSFYPASAAALESLVEKLVHHAQAQSRPSPETRVPVGLLLPHAGLVYSGAIAAAGWAQLLNADPETTVVILGTNHGAAWLDGVGVWDRGPWLLPTGELEVDEPLATAIAALDDPFGVDREAHLEEHSIEVQLPLLLRCAPRGTRIVPLAVSTGRGHAARAAGRRLGELLRDEQASGRSIVLAISTDMAHYPAADVCALVTGALSPAIARLDAAGLDADEDSLRRRGLPNVLCGLCGIEPAIVGLAALSVMGCSAGSVLGSATSADAGGPREETVGYLSVRFDRPDMDSITT